MSARDRVLRFTPQAIRDYDDILLYTEQKFGEAQADSYESDLNRGLETLLAHPFIGYEQESIHLGVRRFPIEHHVVYYRIKKDVIEIIKILHKRANPIFDF